MNLIVPDIGLRTGPPNQSERNSMTMNSSPGINERERDTQGREVAEQHREAGEHEVQELEPEAPSDPQRPPLQQQSLAISDSREAPGGLVIPWDKIQSIFDTMTKSSNVRQRTVKLVNSIDKLSIEERDKLNYWLSEREGVSEMLCELDPAALLRNIEMLRPKWEEF